MDFRDLNHYIDTFTANADVCMVKLRKRWQKGSNMSLVDLKRAFLQVCIHKSLRPFQIVKVDGKRYCLTHLGFSLNVAPLITKAIISMVLVQEETVGRMASMYIDNIYINENIWLSLGWSTKIRNGSRTVNECWDWL